MYRWLCQFLSSSNIQAPMMNSNAIHFILLLFCLPSCSTISLKNFADHLASSDCLRFLVLNKISEGEGSPPVVTGSNVLSAIYNQSPAKNGRYNLFLIQSRGFNNSSINLENQNHLQQGEVSKIISESLCTTVLAESKSLKWLESWMTGLPYGRAIVFLLGQPKTGYWVDTGAQNFPVLAMLHNDTAEMGQLSVVLLCGRCEHQWLQLSDMKISEILEADRKINGLESDPDSVATVMGRFNWKRADHLKFCEHHHYFSMKAHSNGAQCSFNEIVLQILVERFNLSLKTADFHDHGVPVESKAVVRLCVFLCFLDRTHYAASVYMLAMNFDPNFFLYCESTEKLKAPSWTVLVNSFDSSVWLLLVSCSILIGIFQKRASNSVNFMTLLLGHSLIKIRRASVLSAVFLSRQ